VAIAPIVAEMDSAAYVNLKVYNLFKTSDIFFKYPYPKPDMFWHPGKRIKIKMIKTLNPNYAPIWIVVLVCC
jgi:hypothetical protein